MVAHSLAFTVAVVVTATAGRATIVDLTGSNDSGSINGAQFVLTNQQSTGTGVIEPHLRVENTPTNKNRTPPAEPRLMTVHTRPDIGPIAEHRGALNGASYGGAQQVSTILVWSQPDSR